VKPASGSGLDLNTGHVTTVIGFGFVE